MFTGLITGVGTVRTVRPIGGGQDARFTIGVPDGWDLASQKLGASIACSGCCLTAVAIAADAFEVEVSAESLAHTTLGGWAEGSEVNLEGSLRLGDEMGGHIVSGHVDGVAEAVAIQPENGSTRITFKLPPGLSRFVAQKGSITVDGISLTVNEVGNEEFGVNVIPHSWTHTNLRGLGLGSRVNIEIDMLARYVARLTETR